VKVDGKQGQLLSSLKINYMRKVKLGHSVKYFFLCFTKEKRLKLQKGKLRVG